MSERLEDLPSIVGPDLPPRPEPSTAEIILWIVGIRYFLLPILVAPPYFWIRYGSRKSTWFFTAWLAWVLIVAWATISQANLEVEQLLREDERRKQGIPEWVEPEGVPAKEVLSPEDWNTGHHRLVSTPRSAAST